MQTTATDRYADLIDALTRAGYHGIVDTPDPLGERMTVLTPDVAVEIFHPEDNVNGPDPRVWAVAQRHAEPTEMYADATDAADVAVIDAVEFDQVDVTDGPAAFPAIVAILDQLTPSQALVV